MKYFFCLHETVTTSLTFFCNQSTMKSQNWEGKKNLAISWPKISTVSNLETFLYSGNDQNQTPGSVLHKKLFFKKFQNAFFIKVKGLQLFSKGFFGADMRGVSRTLSNI